MPAPNHDEKPSRSDEDRALVAQIREGRLELFHELVRRHESAIYRGAMAILGNPADAEDVTQETFLRAFRSIHRFRGDSLFRTWLIQIAVNVARSRLAEVRRERQQTLVPGSWPAANIAWEPPARAPSPEEQYVWKELGEMFRTILEGLHPRYRSVLYLRDVDNLTTGATAVALGITEESVRTRLRRARAHLRSRAQRILGGNG